MDIKKFINDYNLSDYSVGLGGCRAKNLHFDSCAYDIVVFDKQNAQPADVIKVGNSHAVVHHASFSETDTRKLLAYSELEIVHDESWNLHMLLLRLRQKRDALFSDCAKNSLIESQFCSQKSKASQLEDSDNILASCWQKCAASYLASAILAINGKHPGPSHALEVLRKLEKTSANQHISTVTQTVGIWRATTTLLERMLQSTIGFSRLAESDNHSLVIRQKYDHFVKNFMLSDCYLYLCHTNKENLVKIKNALHNDERLPYILKTAFDVEADTGLIERQTDLLQESCAHLLKDVSDI